MSYESKVHELTLTDFKVDFNKKTLTQCCHNVYSVYRCICFCISVGQNLLFTSLQSKRIRDAAFFLIIMLFTFAATLLKPQNYVSSRTIQKCVEHVSTSTEP